MNIVANVTLLSTKQVLGEVKRSYLAWFSLLHPHSFLDTKGFLAALRGGNNTNVPGTDPSHWELICNEYSIVFEKPGTPPERTIKH